MPKSLKEYPLFPKQQLSEHSFSVDYDRYRRTDTIVERSRQCIAAATDILVHIARSFAQARRKVHGAKRLNRVNPSLCGRSFDQPGLGTGAPRLLTCSWGGISASNPLLAQVNPLRAVLSP